MNDKKFYSALGNMENIISELPEDKQKICDDCMEVFTNLYWDYEELKQHYYEMTGYVYGK